ncbi:hypothetical protein OAQ41_04525 [Candidatus Pelagibacter sp.]|nr:hypothetical protein [Candidatus Pelagibacter sp.]
MNYFKLSVGIFVALAASRFVPHPPNFTSLIALSFYIPIFFGIKFLPVILISFIITDLIIGFHGVSFFTWGTIIFIGFLSNFLKSSIVLRISGALIGASLFYIITNFGVWSLGSYGYTLEGLVICYIVAIPFFGNTLISTIIFSTLIESIQFFYQKYYIKNKI